MGLDTVELVIDVEDEFGIKIDDEDAPNILTVGALVRYVARKKGLRVQEVRQPDPLPYCASARAFYSLRRLLMSEFGAARHSIRPKQRVFEHVPYAERTALTKQLVVWGAHRSMLEGADPGMIICASLFLGASLVGITSFLKLNVTTPVPAAGVIALVAAAVFGLLMARRRFVASHVCWADIARRRAIDIEQEWRAEESLRLESLAHQQPSPADVAAVDRIRTLVYGMVADQFGVKEEELSDATNFVRDLGA